jgi:hypothetical protein
MLLPSRECLADIANALNLTSAVEVGTHQAVFAQAFMRRFRGTIALIDPWDGFDADGDTFYPAFNEALRDRSADLQIARTAMQEFGDRVAFHVGTSEDKVKLFADASVGLVYIDGLHDYASVSRDIRLWYPKVMPGGIFAGHDFTYALPGVVRAVDEFRREIRTEIHLTLADDTWSSWWCVHPLM